MVLFPLFVLILGIVIFYYRAEIRGVLSSPERVSDWVKEKGAAAPIFFIGLQILQVVAFVIPGEVPQIAGGYIFGTGLGTVYSCIGIAAGTVVSFIAARYLGRPFVSSIVRKEKVERFETFTGIKSIRTLFFLLFIIPGIPKDSLCYIAGATTIRFLPFLFLSMLGRLPGIAGSAYIGSAMFQKRWLLAGAIAAAAVVLFVAGYLLRNKIMNVLEKFFKRRD